MVPVVIGALGLNNKNVKKHIQKLPCTLSLQEMQKITLMGTAHIRFQFECLFEKKGEKKQKKKPQ